MYVHPGAVAFHPLESGPQRGFSLIDLIMVLVILGVLAAFAIPRFANVNAKARQAAVRGLAAGLRNSSDAVHHVATKSGLAAASDQTLPFEGAIVKLTYGYPEASKEGIDAAVKNLDGFDETVDRAAGTITYIPKNPPASSATCSVVYTQARKELPAAVELNDGDCS